MLLNEFDQIVREHFDLTDRNTRQFITSLTESRQQDQLMAALSARLYDNIVSKVDDIDFGTIPRSMGDIMKVEKIDMTLESLDIIRRLVIEYKENPSLVDTILTAVENIKDNKSLFVKGYALNLELPMLLYNLIVLSVIRSTSLIIATCVKYIADPSTGSMKKAFDKVAYKDTASDMLFQQLVSFNEMCKNGSMVNILTAVMKNAGRAGAYREDAGDYGVPRYYNIPDPMFNIDPDVIDAEDDEEEYVPGGEDSYDREKGIMRVKNEDEVPNPEVPCPPCNPDENPNGPAVAPEIPEDDTALFGGDDQVVPEPVAPNTPSTDNGEDIPMDTAGVAPIIPENDNQTSPMEAPAESVEKDIETDAKFEDILKGAKEDPISDKESDDLRSGKEKYASSNVEAIKQKLISAANEGDEVSFLAGMIQLNEMVEAGVIDEITANDIKVGAQRVMGAVKDKVGSVINKDNIQKVKNTAGKVVKVVKDKVGSVINKGSVVNKENAGIEDLDDAELRAGKKKYSSNNMEGIKQPGIDNVSESLSGTIGSVAKSYKKYTDSAAGKASAGAATVLGAIWAAKIGFHVLIKVVIPMLRNLIYSYYHTRMKISDYFQIQAELIEANANSLENSTNDNVNDKHEVIKKQRKWAERLRRWSNMFNIDARRTEKEVNDDIKEDEKEKKKISNDSDDDNILF